MGRRDNQRHYRTQVENKLHANAWRHPKLRARTRLLEHAAGERD